MCKPEGTDSKTLWERTLIGEQTKRPNFILLDAKAMEERGIIPFLDQIGTAPRNREQIVGMTKTSLMYALWRAQNAGPDSALPQNLRRLAQACQEGAATIVDDHAPEGTPEEDALIGFCVENRHAADGRNQRILLISGNDQAVPHYLAVNDQRSQRGGRVLVRKMGDTGVLYRPDRVPPLPCDPAEWNRPLPLEHRPSEGDEVWDAERTASLRLAGRLGGGGEADIYEVEGQPDLVAKIYHAGQNTFDRWKKLTRMVAMNIEDWRICAPVLVLYSGPATTPGAGFCGYLMPRAEGIPLSESVFIPDQLRLDHPDWDKRHLVRLAVALLDVICDVHEMGMLVGDLSGNNILVGDSPEDVHFVDVDSWSLGSCVTRVETEGFLAPELIRANDPSLRTLEGENFSIAVFLFELLVTPGRNPYDDGCDLLRNLLDGQFQYPFGSRNNIEPPAPYLYCWSHIPYRIKALFYHTLAVGGERFAPEQRPSAEEWMRNCGWWKHQFDIGHVADPESFRILPTRHKIEYNKTTVTCAICGKEVDQDYCQQDEAGVWYCNPCLKMTTTVDTCACGAPIYYSFYNYYIEHKPVPTLCPRCAARKREPDWMESV